MFSKKHASTTPLITNSGGIKLKTEAVPQKSEKRPRLI